MKTSIDFDSDGEIVLDSERAQALGFTSDKYEGWLWRKGKTILVSFIVSKKRGNFRNLVERIHSMGLTVQVPTPLGRMEHIVRHNNYKQTFEYDSQMGDIVEIWTKEPPHETR